MKWRTLGLKQVGTGLLLGALVSACGGGSTVLPGAAGGATVNAGGSSGPSGGFGGAGGGRGPESNGSAGAHPNSGASGGTTPESGVSSGGTDRASSGGMWGGAGRASAAGATSALGGSGNSTPTAGAGTLGDGYVFAVFNDSAPKSDLVIYTSTDALNFTLLYDTGYTGPTGFLRDPSIMKHTDGKYYVAFTTPPTLSCCGAEDSFSIASSSNLKDWTTVATIPAGVPGVTNTWAPEWFKDKDGSVHAIVTLDGKTYDYKAMNDAFTEFSAPVWIGIGPGYIDTFIVTVGDTYHAFTKGNAYIEHATATSVDGPWTFVGQGDWAGWGTHKEAGAIIDLGNGTWRFFCDAGSTGHEVSSDSKDMFKTWTAPKTLPGVGNDISHGTVIRR